MKIKSIIELYKKNVVLRSVSICMAFLLLVIFIGAAVSSYAESSTLETVKDEIVKKGSEAFPYGFKIKSVEKLFGTSNDDGYIDYIPVVTNKYGIEKQLSKQFCTIKKIDNKGVVDLNKYTIRTGCSQDFYY